MTASSTGFLGKAAADRPFLTVGLIVMAMTAFCVIGVRRAEDVSSASDVISFLLSALYAVGVPMALAAAAPRKTAQRIGFVAAVILGLAGLAVAAHHSTAFPLSAYAPPMVLTLAGLGFFVILMVLGPLTNSGSRFAVIAPFAASLGAAGAAGILAMEGMLGGPVSAASLAVALTAGVAVGFSVGADFAIGFARGEASQQAAARGGHGAIAPAVFAVLAMFAFLIVFSWEANFGALDGTMIWGGVSAALFTVTTSLMAVTAGISLTRPGEQAAVDENRRREWFALAWRPLRGLLPVTSALAGAAIAGVVTVVALFEVGLASPFMFMAFLGIVSVISMLVFVSLRTSVLIAVLLLTASIFTEYAYGLFGAPNPDLLERFCALTLLAVALAQLTVSWRNAGDIWRNARDVTQNAMSDGLRRFLLTSATGAVSLVVAADSLAWSAGYSAAAYFVAMCAVSLVLSPVLMTALSARSSH